MIICCKENTSSTVHFVDMRIQQTLCGKPDMGMGATGARDQNCEVCIARLDATRAKNEAAALKETIQAIADIAWNPEDHGGFMTAVHAIRDTLSDAGMLFSKGAS